MRVVRLGKIRGVEGRWAQSESERGPGAVYGACASSQRICHSDDDVTSSAAGQAAHDEDATSIVVIAAGSV